MSDDTEAEQQPPRMELVRGTATEEELAAVIAVLSATYTHEAASATADERHISAWEATRRGLRTPLRREIPWGRYSG